jgi:hypothetical protein
MRRQETEKEQIGIEKRFELNWKTRPAVKSMAYTQPRIFEIFSAMHMKNDWFTWSALVFGLCYDWRFII